MKKLLMITLSLLLFTMLISPVQAKRLGPLDRPLPDYNNLSLRQIFEDANIITSLTSGWARNNGTLSYVAEGVKITSAQNGLLYPSLYFTSFNSVINNYYYIRNDVLASTTYNDFSITIRILYTPYTTIVIKSNCLSNIVYTLSGKYQFLTDNNKFRVDVPLNNNDYFVLSYSLAINLTTLGISTATTAEMDNLYLDYVKYKDMMNATDVMLIVGQLVAFVWSLVVSFEVFVFVLWEYALFGIGAGFIGYLALKIIQKKAGDDNGDSD